MAVDFTCPHCGHFSRIDEQFVGRTGPCANCGQSITVAANTGAKPQGKPKSNSAVIVLSVVAGVVLCGGGVVAVLVALMLPAINAAREAARRNGCMNQVRQIEMALDSYHNQYGSFPPAYVADSTGKPMHSWRVLILPQLGYQSIYDNYNFEQPWDSASNLGVAGMLPNVYSCPSDPDARAKAETSYMVLVGPETVFPGETTTSLSDISDPHSSTILVVEVESSGVSWTQPMDLPVEQISWKINGPVGNSIGSYHAGGIAMVGFVDGSVVPLSDTTTPQILHDMSTISGREPVQVQF